MSPGPFTQHGVDIDFHVEPGTCKGTDHHRVEDDGNAPQMPAKHTPCRLDEGAILHPELHLADILEIASRFGQQRLQVAHRLLGLAGGIAEALKLPVEIVPGLTAYREHASGPHHHCEAGSQFLLAPVPLVGIEDPEALVNGHRLSTGAWC